eukprot:scpid51061/ scgid8861/ TBC1 domain family member 15; GTPase-activating protein RAB7
MADRDIVGTGDQADCKTLEITQAMTDSPDVGPSDPVAKVFYSKDGVILHVEGRDGAEVHIPGRLELLVIGNSAYVEWQPLGNFDYKTDDESEWAVITPSPNQQDAQSPHADYAVKFAVADITGMRKDRARLGWQRIIFTLRDKGELPSFHFQGSNCHEFWTSLHRFAMIRRSADDSTSYDVTDGAWSGIDPLSMGTPGDVISPAFANYFSEESLLAGFSKVTQFVRHLGSEVGLRPDEGSGTTAGRGATATPAALKTTGHSTHSASPTSPRPGYDFELVEESEITILPAWTAEVCREMPIDLAEWQEYLDGEGRVVKETEFRRRLFKGGLEPSLRHHVWKFLLSHYDFDSSAAGREKTEATRQYVQCTCRCALAHSVSPFLTVFRNVLQNVLPPPPPPPPTPAQPVVSPPAFLAQPHRQQQQQQRPPVLGNGIMGSPPPAMSPAELIAAASSGSLPQAALQASLLTALSDITARQQIVNQQLAAKVIHSKQQMIAATLVNLVVQNSQYLQTGLLPPAVLQKLQQQQAAYRQQLRLDGLDSTSPRLPGLSSVSSTSSSGISSADDYLLDSSTQPFSPDGSDSSTSSLMHDAQFSFRPCASDTSTPGDTSLVTPPCRARRNRFHSGPKSPCQTSDHGSSDFSRCSSSHSSRDSRTRARMRTSSEALDHCSPVVSQQSVGMLGSDSENPIEQVHVQQTDLSSTKLPCYSEKHPAHVPPTAQANCAVLPDRSVDHIAQHSEPSAVDPAVAAKHFVPVPEQCPSSSDACAYAKPAMAACKQRGTSATAVLCAEPFVPVSLPLVSASGGRAAVPTAQPSFAQSMPESTVADAAPCAKPEVPHSILPSAALSPPPPPPDTAPVEDKPLDAKPFVPFSTKSVCVSSGVCTTTAVSASKTDKEGSVTQSIESPVVLRSILATNAGAVRTVPTYDWHRPVPPATSPNPRCTPSVATPEAETCSEGRTANVNNLNEMPSQLDSPRKKCKKDMAASSARPAKPNSVKRSEVGKIANSSSRGEVTDKLRSPKAKQARGSSTTNTSTLKTPPRTYSGNLPKAGKADRASRSGTVCRQQSPNQKHTKEEVTTKATMSNNSSPEMFASAKSTDTVSNRHSSVGTPHIQEPPAAVTARPHTPPRTASTGLAESVTESPPLSQCSAARTRTRPVDPRRSGRLYSDLFAEDSKSETLDAPIPAWANDKAWVQPAEFDFTTIEISSTASTQPERKTAAVHSSQSGVKLNCLEDSSTDDGVVRADAANGVASTDFNARLCGEIDAGSVPMHLQGEKQQHHQQQQQQQ